MNSRERVIGAIERTKIDRVPRHEAYWEDTIELYHDSGMPSFEGYPEIEIEGQKKKIGDPVHSYFNSDIDMLYMDVSMRLPSRVVSDDGEFIVIEDRSGYTAKKFKGKASSMDFMDHFTKNREIWNDNKHRFIFDPKDTSRIDNESYYLRLKPYLSWDGTKKLFDEYRAREKYIAVFCYGPYEATWRHRGYAESLMDLAMEPEWMSEMFEAVTTLMIDTLKHAISVGVKPDAFWLAEDMGGTHATLFSRDMYRELIWPQHKRLGDFLHENGIHFMMHSCGKIEPLLPDLIDAGLDVIQALQANTGMDVRELKKAYGDKLTFFGNIGEQTFKNGKEAIEEEIRSKVPVAMEGGGYIFHSDHSIPPEVSYETYQHALKVLDEVGRY